ncbi:hypothetical protein Q9966_011871 [Columba livia]|nr:hypothetical protein Q9966_011871 [Columba livia]
MVSFDILTTPEDVHCGDSLEINSPVYLIWDTLDTAQESRKGSGEAALIASKQTNRESGRVLTPISICRQICIDHLPPRSIAVYENAQKMPQEVFAGDRDHVKKSASSTRPECSIMQEIEEERSQCLAELVGDNQTSEWLDLLSSHIDAIIQDAIYIKASRGIHGNWTNLCKAEEESPDSHSP